MSNEIFTKDGKLRKKPPLKYECLSCKNKFSKFKNIKYGSIGFVSCPSCRSNIISERDAYHQWEKRNTGEYDIEVQILELLTRESLISKEKIKEKVIFNDVFIFDKTFAYLCFLKKINIVEAPDGTNIYEKSKKLS